MLFSTLRRFGSALRGILRVLARPGRIGWGRGGLTIRSFRGFGTSQEAFLIGMVRRERGIPERVLKGRILGDLAALGRRMMGRGVAGVEVGARMEGVETRAITDRDGYFRFHLKNPTLSGAQGLWRSAELEVFGPESSASRTRGLFFVPPPESRFVVVSDIDDTVMETGVFNRMKMFWRLFFQGAGSRIAFPGMAAFLRALHQGGSGEDYNPLLYVSRGPWGIYDMLVEFFHMHRIPVGPILFLREWGLSPLRPIPRRDPDHKLDLIRRMLSIYHDFPFILIGDSGQHDPEIYTRIVRENPGRIVAVYIRNVRPDPERRRSIENLAEKVIEDGSTLLLASDSFAMAEHAAEKGFIASGALAGILAERQSQEGEEERGGVLPQVTGASGEEGLRALRREGVAGRSGGRAGSQAPTNIRLEPEEDGPDEKRRKK